MDAHPTHRRAAARPDHVDADRARGVLCERAEARCWCSTSGPTRGSRRTRRPLPPAARPLAVAARTETVLTRTAEIAAAAGVVGRDRGHLHLVHRPRPARRDGRSTPPAQARPAWGILPGSVLALGVSSAPEPPESTLSRARWPPRSPAFDGMTYEPARDRARPPGARRRSPNVG